MNGFAGPILLSRVYNGACPLRSISPAKSGHVSRPYRAYVTDQNTRNGAFLATAARSSRRDPTTSRRASRQVAAAPTWSASLSTAALHGTSGFTAFGAECAIGAPARGMAHFIAMAGAESGCAQSGHLMTASALGRWPMGTAMKSRSIVSTMMAITSRGIAGGRTQKSRPAIDRGRSGRINSQRVKSESSALRISQPMAHKSPWPVISESAGTRSARLSAGLVTRLDNVARIRALVLGVLA